MGVLKVGYTIAVGKKGDWEEAVVYINFAC